MAWTGQKTSKITLKMSRSALSGDRTGVTYIGIHALYFHWMAPIKDIKTQEGIPTSHSGSPTTKVAWIGQKTSKIIPKCHVPLCQGSRKMLHRQQTSFSNKLPSVKILGLKRGFLHLKPGRPQKRRTWIDQKTSKITPNMSCSTLSGDPTGGTLATNHSIFV